MRTETIARTPGYAPAAKWTQEPIRLVFSADETRDAPLPWQELGLTQTASGYGAKLCTRTQVRHLGRWKRVYCVCYSNSGTCFIMVRGKQVTVDID